MTSQWVQTFLFVHSFMQIQLSCGLHIVFHSYNCCSIAWNGFWSHVTYLTLKNDFPAIKWTFQNITYQHLEKKIVSVFLLFFETADLRRYLGYFLPAIFNFYHKIKFCRYFPPVKKRISDNGKISTADAKINFYTSLNIIWQILIWLFKF